MSENKFSLEEFDWFIPCPWTLLLHSLAWDSKILFGILLFPSFFTSLRCIFARKIKLHTSYDLKIPILCSCKDCRPTPQWGPWVWAPFTSKSIRLWCKTMDFTPQNLKWTERKRILLGEAHPRSPARIAASGIPSQARTLAFIPERKIRLQKTSSKLTTRLYYCKEPRSEPQQGTQAQT